MKMPSIKKKRGRSQAFEYSCTLEKKYGADITVVVIDENSKDAIADHDA
jgi:hypothetical protein